ncbi:MAG: EAL domain-containing protein, partial [Betaproteobacteria bacterium]
MSLKKMQSSSEIPAVLVIESAKFQRRSLCRLIRAAGADRVAEAIGIKDAERVLAKDTASHWLVVADPELIGNDGIPALKALADAFPVVGTLLLSHRRANLLGELRGQAERHGLDFIAVLRKPVSAEEMGTLLLQTRRLQIPGRSADTRMRILGKEELSECLRAGGLRARFQPKVDLDTGCPVGCEAAPFVNHANGVLSFASFSQALKQLNAQRVMTASLLRDAAELVGLLRERSLGAKVAVKLGADMLSEAGDAASLDAYVRTLGIAPSDLAFEVTDGTKAASSFTFDDNLARLKVRG